MNDACSDGQVLSNVHVEVAAMQFGTVVRLQQFEGVISMQRVSHIIRRASRERLYESPRAVNHWLTVYRAHQVLINLANEKTAKSTTKMTRRAFLALTVIRPHWK